MAEQYGLGIDLGTTQTAAAVRTDGRIEIVRLGGRRAEIPSLVFVRADGGLLIGDAAERRGLAEPGRLAREFKRRIGDPVPILVGGVPFSAHALTAKLLRHVLDTVTRLQGGPPAVLTVTHPANWGPYKRELLDQALRLADTGPVLLRTEPEAAALQHATARRIEVGETVAVYDLGGGTFDAAVLRREGEGFLLLGEPEGIEQLGGADFDEAVFGHVLTGLGSQVENLDPNEPEVVTALARLRRDCVEAKEALSFDTEVMIPVALPGVHTRVRLNRSELEAMIAPALADTVTAMHRALRAAGVTPAGLDAVLLAGGSSRIPLVGELLATAFDKPVVADPHPEHSIAMGAAVSTALITGGASPFAAAVTPPPHPAATPASGPDTNGDLTAPDLEAVDAGPPGAAATGPISAAASGTAHTAATAPIDPGATGSSNPSATGSASKGTTGSGSDADPPPVSGAESSGRAADAPAEVPAQAGSRDSSGSGAIDNSWVLPPAVDPWAEAESAPLDETVLAEVQGAAVTQVARPEATTQLTPQQAAAQDGLGSTRVRPGPPAGQPGNQPVSGAPGGNQPVAYSRGAASVSGPAPELPHTRPIPQQASLPPSAPGVSGGPAGAAKRRTGLAVLAGVLTLAVISGITFVVLRDRADTPDAAGTKASQPATAEPVPPDTMLIRVDTGGDERPERRSGVFLLTPGDDTRTPISDTGSDELPEWSRDRKRLAVTQIAKDGTASVSVMDADGSGPDKVIENMTGRVSWSKDGSKLAFMRKVGGSPQLFVVKIGETEAVQLTTAAGEKDDPAWSPDGASIAYWAKVGDQRQIFVLDVDDPDGPGKQVTDGDSGPGVDPAWSPDSRSIAYTRGFGGETSDIWVIGVDGKGARPVADSPLREMDPSWAPGQQWLAFTRGPLNRPKVVIHRLSDGQEQTLTRGSAREGHPCWF